MASKARAAAKRHIYRCLSTILGNDLDAGCDYLCELADDSDTYKDPKLNEEAMNSVVEEVQAELRRRGEPKRKR